MRDALYSIGIFANLTQYIDLFSTHHKHDLWENSHYLLMKHLIFWFARSILHSRKARFEWLKHKDEKNFDMTKMSKWAIDVRNDVRSRAQKTNPPSHGRLCWDLERSFVKFCYIELFTYIFAPHCIETYSLRNWNQLGSTSLK